MILRRYPYWGAGELEYELSVGIMMVKNTRKQVADFKSHKTNKPKKPHKNNNNNKNCYPQAEETVLLTPHKQRYHLVKQVKYKTNKFSRSKKQTEKHLLLEVQNIEIPLLTYQIGKNTKTCETSVSLSGILLYSR